MVEIDLYKYLPDESRCFVSTVNIETSYSIEISYNTRNGCKKLVLYLFACPKKYPKKAPAIDIQPDCGKEL